MYVVVVNSGRRRDGVLNKILKTWPDFVRPDLTLPPLMDATATGIVSLFLTCHISFVLVIPPTHSLSVHKLFCCR